MKKLPMLLLPLLILALIVGAAGCSTDDGVTPATALTPTTTTTPTPMLTPIQTPTSTPEANYITHTDDLNGFSIKYPEEWQMRASAYSIFAVQAPEQCKGHEVAFYLQRIQLPSVIDTEGYFGSILCDTFSSPERYFISGERVGVSGMAAIKWVTSFESVYGIPLKEMSFYLLDNGAAWTLSFTAASACWRQYEAVFQHIVDSFQLS
jgi:hypothetical protein